MIFYLQLNIWPVPIPSSPHGKKTINCLIIFLMNFSGQANLIIFRNYEFEFLNIEKPYESYTGTNVRLRYCIRATVMRGMTTPNIVKENEFLVHMLSHYPNVANPLKMEVRWRLFSNLEIQGQLHAIPKSDVTHFQSTHLSKKVRIDMLILY